MGTILSAVGGLALFLYGIRVLSQGMEQLAGGKLQEWLDKATSKPWKGATFGAVATSLLQSSSLLMVTMIGLINGGLLTLEQAIGVMLGQEIGTTLTGQLIAFDVGAIRFVAVAVGVLLLEFGEDKWHRYGQILLGFGILFMGMTSMSGSLKPMAGNPLARKWLAQMGQNPLLGVVAGAVFTAVIQSSSAMTGLVVAMGTSGVITLPGAIGLIYGANIGTCLTGMIASSRASVPARRASVAQIIINVLGVVIFLPFVMPYASVLERTSSSLPRQIANAHTIFNLAVSAVLFPFVRPIVRLTSLVVPDRAPSGVPKVTHFIDYRLRRVPSIAILEAANELDRLGATTLQMLELSHKALVHEEMDAATEVLRLEREIADPLCDAVERFLDDIIAEEIDRPERGRCFQLKNANVDLERVADHAENMAEAAQDRINHQVPFSELAINDLNRAFNHAKLTLETSLAAFREDDRELAWRTCRLEDEMDRIELDARQAHMNRLSSGICHPEAGVLFVETLRNLERIGDHADNLAVSILRKS
ncbi:MAG TPA: Na/Pi cotransporter family protein [Anaerolineae bacterium]|nr:Na/Pi cotransporter family protein [Anaerolineae bacterium]